MRNEIIVEAQEQLKLGGYDNLNFAKIADKLSTTRANLHHHFTNKEGLAYEATRAYIDAKKELIDSLVQESEGNFIVFLNHLEKLMIEVISRDGDSGSCVCNQLLKDSNVPEQVKTLAREHILEVQLLFSSLIRTSQEKKILSATHEAEKLALMTHTVILGVAQMAMIRGRDPLFLDAIDGLLGEWISQYK